MSALTGATSAAPAVLTWSQVTARRMARHALTEPAADLGPADIAGVLCGAHAQVLSAAELSIGRRVAGATRADVQRALWQERTLVKTFGCDSLRARQARVWPAFQRRVTPCGRPVTVSRVGFGAMQLPGARYSVRRATAQRPSPSCAARVGSASITSTPPSATAPDVVNELFREGKRLVTVTGIGGDRQDLPGPAAVLERQ